MPWTAINPATVIDGFYNYGDMQYIGIADMIGKLYQGRLLALPGGRDTFLPLCNMQYIVSFLIRTMSYPETIAQEYMLLDPATPKFHRLVHLAAEHLGVSSPHLQIPKVLLGIYRGLFNPGQEDALMCVMLGTGKPTIPNYPPEHPLSQIKR
ncbi:hypothetical protein [Klebsiella pneumoniae]